MLVVAHGEANLRLLEDFLDGLGQPVQAASSPDEIAALPDPEAPPDAALVDVDGYGSEIWELVDRLREAGAAVVVLTRYRTAEIQQATLAHPVRSVLEKPVRKAQLQVMVETLTD